MPLFRNLFRLGALSVPTAGAGWYAYTWNTYFVPFSTRDADYETLALRKVNPLGNPPACIDHAVRSVPLKNLKTTDVEELTKEFCRGVWAGPGFWYQRRYLQKKYRALPGREEQLWDRHQLGVSDYPVGTKLVDHFEVVERGPGKVSWLRIESRLRDGFCKHTS